MWCLSGTSTLPAQDIPTDNRSQGVESEEAFDTGWQFYFDNDISFGDEKDRNYTGGLALTLSGKRAAEYWFSIDDWLNGLDRLSGFESLQQRSGGIDRHAIEFGLTIFTPDDIAAKTPVADDHPYANMLFMANSQTRIYPQRGLIYQSTLVEFHAPPVGVHQSRTDIRRQCPRGGQSGGTLSLGRFKSEIPSLQRHPAGAVSGQRGNLRSR